MLPDPAVESGRGGPDEVALSVSALDTFEVGGLEVSVILAASVKGVGRGTREGIRTHLMIPNIPFAQCCPTVQ